MNVERRKEGIHVGENSLTSRICHCLLSDSPNLDSTSSLLGGEGMARMLELGSTPNWAAMATGFLTGDNTSQSICKLYSRQMFTTVCNWPVLPEFGPWEENQRCESIFSSLCKIFQAEIRCDKRLSRVSLTDSSLLQRRYHFVTQSAKWFFSHEETLPWKGLRNTCQPVPK